MSQRTAMTAIHTRLSLFFIFMSAILLACANPAASDSGSGAIDDSTADALATLRYNLWTEPPTADPALATDTTSFNVIRATMMGLTQLNPDDNSAEPALAQTWSVSDDGLTWTFDLRTDVPWVRYQPETGVVEPVIGEDSATRMVSAQDVAYGITRVCDPATASNYAYILYLIAGCQAANTGEGAVDAVAVHAIDDATLEITTEFAAGYLPQILSMVTAFPAPRWIIEGYGDVWTEPESTVANGPFVVAEWIHGDSMRLVRNPHWPGWHEDAHTGNIGVIEFFMVEEYSTELAMYENNELDDSIVPQDQIERVFAESGELAAQGNIVPVNCTQFYGFVTQKEAVQDPRVRRALSMAVDRQTLVTQITQGGEIPANTFTNPANFGSAASNVEIAPWALSDDQGGSGYAAALEMAQELMRDSGYPDGNGLSLTIGYNTNEDNARITQAMQAMWSAAFPQIQITVENQEWGVYISSLLSDAPLETKPEVYRLAWCKDYPHANNWLHEVWNPQAGPNFSLLSPEDPQIGDLVAEYTQLTFDAQTATDSEAIALYKRAEQLLVDEMAVLIPLYYDTNVRVTKPWLERIYGEDGNLKFEYWQIDTAAQEGL